MLRPLEHPEVAGGTAWLDPFVEDFRARLMTLLGGAFREVCVRARLCVCVWRWGGGALILEHLQMNGPVCGRLPRAAHGAAWGGLPGGVSFWACIASLMRRSACLTHPPN